MVEEHVVDLLPGYALGILDEADLILVARHLPACAGCRAALAAYQEAAAQAAESQRVGLADAFDLGGWGRGSTWPVTSFFRYLPGVRLDHIYLGGGLTCSDCRTGVGEGSDHRPVIAKIGFAR